MTAQKIMHALGSMFNGLLWKWHLDNLSLMVEATMRSHKLGVASLGRSILVETTPKHAIKRVDRFLGNGKVDDIALQLVLMRTVIGNRKRVFISVDWTKIRAWDTLVAGVVHKGRSIAVLWAVWDPKVAYKSRNAFENAFFTLLSRHLPEGVKAVVLLDRGYKRMDLITHLRQCKLSFVIRTSGPIRVESAHYNGPLDDAIARRGQRVDISDALMRADKPIAVRVVGLWDKRQKEPWLLMTDLDWVPTDVAAAYGMRFRIEEMFRDKKDARFGLFLGHVKMLKAKRLERMLLIAALTHFIAMLVGGLARRLGYDRQYRANTGMRCTLHSDFTLGMYYYTRLRWTFIGLLREFFCYMPTELRG